MFVAAAVLTASAIIGALTAHAAPPSVVHADIDYDASGYVTPAGMVPPTMYTGGVMPVGYMAAIGGLLQLRNRLRRSGLRLRM